MPRSHRDLVVWQKAMDMVAQVYELTELFPRVERYGLTAQLRRAAVSVPCNIAEGSGRGAIREYSRFLAIARGSAMEAETIVAIARRVGHVTPEESAATLQLLDEICRMLAVLRKRIRPTR